MPKIKPVPVVVAAIFAAAVVSLWPFEASVVYDERGVFQQWAINRQWDAPTEYKTIDYILGPWLIVGGILVFAASSLIINASRHRDC